MIIAMIRVEIDDLNYIKLSFITVNLVPFGPDVGDHEVFPGMLNPGKMIDLHMYFPFYGGLYNYSIVSVYAIIISINKICK
uniref:COesterase domain-containing protein n=1 Tax=Ascaris lumbricoides TaxID=6252 RepID=A0A0M3HFP7_ASCLU